MHKLQRSPHTIDHSKPVDRNQSGSCMSEAKASFTYRRIPDVVSTTIQRDETVLRVLSSLRYFSLNGTGSRIWRHLTGDADLALIAEPLTKQCDIDGHEAHRY